MLLRFFKLSCIAIGLLFSMSSCNTAKLYTTKIAYQSIRTTEYHESTPEEAQIVVGYGFTGTGKLVVTVHNRTDEVMIIDQTRSFFVDTDGKSYSYYDPTIKTKTITDISSSTSGASVNLGSVAGLFGVGGMLGRALSGVNVGGSDTYGQSVSNTTYIADYPQYSLGPKGVGILNKYYPVTHVGSTYLKQEERPFNVSTENDSPYRFSVCITYSLDGGTTYEKLITDFYVNSQIIESVNEYGRVNKALRQLYIDKPDALYEPCWILYFVSNVSDKAVDVKSKGILLDYK